jgi:dTDP-glucose 4,6-dehydratase
MDGDIVNIGNPAEVTIRELAEKIRELFAPRIELEFEASRPGDPQRRQPDITHIRSTYGWHPQVALDQGLRITEAWFREAGRRPTAVSRRKVERLVPALRP